MEITLKSLKMVNFKGFRDYSIMFNELCTEVYGPNKGGKTTIADAITWCLFGKDSNGRTAFSLKTHDSEGTIIPHLEHYVEMCIDCDGEERTLRRAIREKWNKLRNEDKEVLSGNVTEFYVDGQMMTASEYKKFISSLISEDVFMAITVPDYFTGLPWQKQREFLVSLVGELPPSVVLEKKQEFADLLPKLEKDGGIGAYKKKLAYLIGKVKSELATIPIRLEEQQRAMPEKSDWEDVEELIKNQERELESVKSSIAQLRYGNADDAMTAILRKKLDFAQHRLDEMERSARNMATMKADEHDKDVRIKRMEVTSISQDIASLEAKSRQDKILIDRAKETLQSVEAEKENIRKSWAETKNDKFDIDNDVTVCPLCGQQLPEDKLREKIDKMRKDFNTRREHSFIELREKAEHLKSMEEDARNTIKSFEEEERQTAERQTALHEKLDAARETLKELESKEVPSWKGLLQRNVNYSTTLKELKDIKSEMETPRDSNTNGTELESLEHKAACIVKTINAAREKLAIKSQYEKSIQLIKEIEDRRVQLVSQLSELERDEDMAKEFESYRGNMLEERINKHFSIVKWKLFKELVNGDKENYCECYVDGSAYHDGLNSAGRLNAGLDIINTLCRFYGSNAPIVIDNAERCTDILETRSQQIRLYVSRETNNKLIIR